MTALDVAIQIADDIENRILFGRDTDTPITSWCAWENDFFRFVIIVFSGVSGVNISRSDFNDMLSIFVTRFGVRVSYIQETGILVVETLYSESGIEKIKPLVYRNDKSNSLIHR